jgi:aspartate/methionine/tyrosine aminotransferase
VTYPDLCFTLNGISKLLALPGLKLGWIAVSGRNERIKDTVDSLEIMADTFLSVHDPIQQALPKLLEGSEVFRQTYRNTVQSRWQSCQSALLEIPQLKWVAPQGGFYLTLRVEGVNDRGEEQWVLDLMEQKGVFVHPGYFFDLEEGIHFVFTYLTEPATVHDALGKIGEFIKRK